MTLEEFFRNLRSDILNYNNGRTDTSAFIIWFLENFFRIDRQDAIDCVCDQQNDKGIDAIFVDDEEEIIYLIQSKFSPTDHQNQGDNDLRNFIGAKQWFTNSENLNNLLESTASNELKSLIKSSKLNEKTHYALRLVFITNKNFNVHANEFIAINEDLEAWDCNDLHNKYTYFADNDVKFPVKDLYLSNTSKIEYNLPDGTIARAYTISAKELVKLEGIQDRTLFYKNVRYSVGKTRVNKSIKDNILDQSQHNNFFLYHNGITIVCEELNEDLSNSKISIGNYAVINGCQSMLTLYENKDKLTRNLFILVKIIKLSLNSSLVKDITYYANNQNAIGLKDLRSNDSVQKSLQNEFKELFDDKVFYSRKKGEDLNGYDDIIDKDFAAQIIKAVYLKKPQDTHLKQKLFGDDYNAIFSRKINAEKIYFGYLVYNIIYANSNLLENEKIRNYGLSIFFFSSVIATILEEDNIGKLILENPKEFVTTNKEILENSLKKMWNLITPDINFDIVEYTSDNNNFFDYKNVFKNGEWVRSMTNKIKTDYVRLTRRNENDTFENIYNTFLNEQ
ncbi:AIPR family protein [Flavobacterium sp. UMI-01]|uniref:AIPR family protein n=1 Tax=Flavobacterium sp. UMI-01 TaxID=1441053 RepID=UPI001C7CF158|nr:AIPR family protein [Flavobacterium sp. UMI-01]GIZ09859.1 hypothetical protein FUMI01_25850 [Flavobacterium sp. UMI-01]